MSTLSKTLLLQFITQTCVNSKYSVIYIIHTGICMSCVLRFKVLSIFTCFFHRLVILCNTSSHVGVGHCVSIEVLHDHMAAAMLDVGNNMWNQVFGVGMNRPITVHFDAYPSGPSSNSLSNTKTQIYKYLEEKNWKLKKLKQIFAVHLLEFHKMYDF